MNKIKLLALFLALVTVVSAFAACGGGVVDTTAGDDVTDKPETIVPDTNTPETDDPSIDTPDTDISDDETPVVVPEPDVVIVDLDFETDLVLADYIAATEGLEINEALNGGEIRDGKLYYTGKALAIKDGLGIYDRNYYSVEFDFCFNSFVNKDSTSVFSFITDDDGVLNGDTSTFYIPFKLNMDGNMYHNSAANMPLQLEAGKVYHYKVEVNNVDKTMSVYVNDTLLVTPSYKQAPREYNCFRIMDNSRGADMWIDNFVVTDTEALQNASTDTLARAVDGAFTRGGKYANEVHPLAEGTYIDIKYQNGDASYCREGFVKFDISKLISGKVGYAMMYMTFANIGADSLFDIYWVTSDWDSSTITYNNMPLGKLIMKDVKLSGLGTVGGFEPYINEAIAKGDKYFSIRIVPTYQSGNGQARLYYTSLIKPSIIVVNGETTKNYMETLVDVDDEAENKAIWDYAQRMYDEWYARYQALPAVNEDAVLLGRDESQYTKTNYMSGQSTNYNSSKTAHKSRPFDALTDFDEYVSKEFKNAKLDKYGGAMIESLKQEAKGVFYTTKIDGRWWMIDPLGYPYISIGLSDIHYSQLGSKLQKENALKLYGDYDTWALATTRQVREELYFNNTFRPVSNIIDLDNGLPFAIQKGVLSNYAKIKGVIGDGNGSTVFTENNTMPVFDPDFVSYADSWAKTNIKYAGNDRLIGYMSDNELPINTDMLDRSLTVNFTRSVNNYTYACAWTWLKNITGKDDPNLDDVTDELRDLYRGFVYDRYFYVVSAAVKKYDPDHMYMGTRFLTKTNQSEWVLRFAAQYLDCMTMNWYGDWEPDANALYGISKNGDIPFIVTEFYTKAGDSGLGNTSGAGRFVKTQTDRADFYETFTIRLLESPNCVGWQWFQYMDNDPNSGTGDASSIDSNKGIYTSEFTLYTELTDRMTILNKNVYNIIDYFANKNAD